MVVTYQFYTDEYRGKQITNADDWQRDELTAEIIVKKYVTIDPENVPLEVKYCICAIADVVDGYSNAQTISSKGIQSESVAGYSVSYSNSTTVKTNYNQSIRDILALYLGSEVLYRGVGRHVL